MMISRGHSKLEEVETGDPGSYKVERKRQTQYQQLHDLLTVTNEPYMHVRCRPLAEQLKHKLVYTNSGGGGDRGNNTTLLVCNQYGNTNKYNHTQNVFLKFCFGR